MQIMYIFCIYFFSLISLFVLQSYTVMYVLQLT